MKLITCFWSLSPTGIKKFMLFVTLFFGMDASYGQEIDFSNCPNCASADIQLVSEVNTKYLGVKGRNPAAPLTYGAIGTHKFNGFIPVFDPIFNFFEGDNWLPFRNQKQILCGKMEAFGISEYGDEFDWNIGILPNPGFDDFIEEALPYKDQVGIGVGGWAQASNGKYTIEGEITPDESRKGNPWFPSNGRSPVISKEICVYGPFVREEIHNNNPEIHPTEIIWWKEADNVVMVLLANDDSNRFEEKKDYTDRNVTDPNWKPWTQENGQESEMRIAFEVDIKKEESVLMSVQALDILEISTSKLYPDAAQGQRYSIVYKGRTIFSLTESSNIDNNLGVTFENVCLNVSKNTIQGFVVLKAAVGNGDGKEGLVALRIEKLLLDKNDKLCLLKSDATGVSWKTQDVYDDKFLFTEAISTDRKGLGIVNGHIDFNGNGITDLFCKAQDNRWMVLYDSKGQWQKLGQSSVDINALRFGDVNGDKKTDILYVSGASEGRKLMVYYGGTGAATKISDETIAGSQSNLRVGDFNGDGKTDFVKFEMKTVNVGSVGFPKMENVFTSSILWGCKGKWAVLSSNYKFANSIFNNVNDLRFGHFNADSKTDIWGYQSGKMGTFLGGTGEATGLKIKVFQSINNNLFFAHKFPYDDQTGIIYVDPATKKFTYFYYGGESNSAPLTMKYDNPENIRYAELDGKGAFEQMTTGIAKIIPNPATEVPVEVPLVKAESVALAEYTPGSLRRVQAGDKQNLVIDMDVKVYPGAPNGKRSKTDFQKIASITQVRTNKTLSFKATSNLKNKVEEPEVIGKMENISLAGADENKLKVAFTNEPSAWNCEAPRYTITARPKNITLTKATPKGDWNHWKTFLAAKSTTDMAKILNITPIDIEKTESIRFELMPFFATVEKEGTLGSIEMDEMVKELNNIAYGTNAVKTTEIFIKTEVFKIVWKFELKNLTTGAVVPLDASRFKIDKGHWANSQVAFNFPVSDGLLEIKAIATISDPLGVSNLVPVELKFWNQRIHLTDAAPEIDDWLKTLKSGSKIPYSYYQTRLNYFARDNYLTPLEMQRAFEK